MPAKDPQKGGCCQGPAGFLSADGGLKEWDLRNLAQLRHPWQDERPRALPSISWSELVPSVDDVKADSALQRALKHCRSRKELIRAALRLGYRITRIDLQHAWQEEQRDEELGFSWDGAGCRSDCSWFGIKLAVKPSAPFSRTELAQELDRQLIGNRMLFGSNLLRQPGIMQRRFVHTTRMHAEETT